MKLLILADDFTGAMDTGVQLSLRGVSTKVVVTESAAANCDLQDCQVLSVNMETRHLSQEKAYYCMKSFLEKYAPLGCHVYLKTDSALRGTIAAAFQAAMDVMGGPVSFIPAYPALNRTTRDGICYIQGVPLEQSVFQNDPENPALYSDITKILTHKVAHFQCKKVPSDQIEQFDRECADPKNTVFLFDCETEEQIDRIGQELSRRRLYGLTAGCAGFARTFCTHLSLQAEHGSPPAPKDDPLLIVSGSANPITLEQIAYAGEKGYQVLSLSGWIRRCRTDPGSQNRFLETVFAQAVKTLGSGRSLILATAASPEDLEKDRDAGFHETVARFTSSLVQLILEETETESLAVFGGDMVAAILKKLECACVRAWGQICTGVPLCTFSHKGRTRFLATKSGGFGQPDVILKIQQYFTHKEDTIC